MFKSKSIAVGLAMFSMFFGAGNLIFPLAIGQFAGEKNLFAMMGLIVTAVMMPIMGVIAMILYEGDYRQFFGRLGKIPGFCIALLTISLLGPLGSTPRCIALSYTTLKGYLLEPSIATFSFVSCMLIFFLSIKKRILLNLLGWILTPLLLLSLVILIVLGLIFHPEPLPVQHSEIQLFFYGLKEGYNTMDLLASFFFSSMIWNILKNSVESPEEQFRIAKKASVIGGVLLATIYTGFSFLASFYGADLGLNKEAILSHISIKIAGEYGGLLVSVMVSLACLTTAIALITSFVDFIHQEVFAKRIGFEWILGGSICLTFIMSTFEFSGISAFLGPILEICYPVLIALTIWNLIFHRRRPLFLKNL